MLRGKREEKSAEFIGRFSRRFQRTFKIKNKKEKKEKRLMGCYPRRKISWEGIVPPRITI